MDTNDFVKTLTGLSSLFTLVDRNPASSGWPAGTRHFYVKLYWGNKIFETYYSMGPGITEDPTVADVLDCLAMDALSVHEYDFNPIAWAREFGDPDASKAMKTYEVICDQTASLEDFLGHEKFQELLYDTERL